MRAREEPRGASLRLRSALGSACRTEQVMSTATPATQALKRAGVAFRTIEYDYVAGQDRIGLHAAEAIGVPPERVLKTLMVEVDGKPA